MKKRLLKLTLVGAILALLLVGTAGPVLAADPPEQGKGKEKGIVFICPSVSLKNAKGMWVMGDHGAYYVRVPTKGGKNEGSKIFVNVPVHVTDKAQIPAGWGLYKDYPSYPYFEGDIMLLEEGLVWLLGAPGDWTEGDMLNVTKNLDGSYTVHNMGPMMSPVDKGILIIWTPIPLASAVFW